MPKRSQARSSRRTQKRPPSAVFPTASLQFLEQYLNTPSPTGFEVAGQRVWRDYIAPFVDEVRVDAYGSAYGVVQPDAPWRVVVEAHVDEISWFVSYITEAGLLHVKTNGGSDHQIAPSKRVTIHTKKGPVKGVFGWPAIHTRKAGGSEEQPSVKNLCIDIGATSKAEVEQLGVHVGAVLTYDDGFTTLNDRYFVGRALDNRIGGFMIAEVARLLHHERARRGGKKLPFGVYFANCVQEEVGLRGAQMLVHTIKPNLALVTDVCHDTSTPMIQKAVEGDTVCGKGPVVTYGPAVHNTVRELLIDTAAAHKIPIQRDAASRSTGTDTDAFAYANGGVPSALVNLPLRYMHTTVEMAQISDVDQVIKLLYHTLRRLSPSMTLTYL